MQTEHPCEEFAEFLIGFSLQRRGMDLDLQDLAKPADNLASGSIGNRLDFKTADFHGVRKGSGETGQQLFVDPVKGPVA